MVTSVPNASGTQPVSWQSGNVRNVARILIIDLQRRGLLGMAKNDSQDIMVDILHLDSLYC